MKRVASSVLLAAGIALVFFGMNRALGASVASVLVTIGAIAALLYAGGAWFGSPPTIVAPAGTSRVVVFDRALEVIAGAVPRMYLPDCFPEEIRSEVEEHCRAALRGEHRHFSCEIDGTRVLYEVAPVPNATGLIMYGTLVAGAGTAVRAVASRPAETVA